MKSEDGGLGLREDDFEEGPLMSRRRILGRLGTRRLRGRFVKRTRASRMVYIKMRMVKDLMHW